MPPILGLPVCPTHRGTRGAAGGSAGIIAEPSLGKVAQSATRTSGWHHWSSARGLGRGACPTNST